MALTYRAIGGADAPISHSAIGSRSRAWKYATYIMDRGAELPAHNTRIKWAQYDRDCAGRGGDDGAADC